jgi:hypothetical protein
VVRELFGFLPGFPPQIQVHTNIFEEEKRVKKLITICFEKKADRRIRWQKIFCRIAALVLALGGLLGAQAQAATSYTAIDLNPSGFDMSYAYGTSGTQQVGWGYPTGSGVEHALLWSGSAASYVDLNPSGFTESQAFGISGTQQVGYGYGSATGGVTHALLWNGSADSYVDLNPRGFITTYAWGTNGTQQVGEGDGHALLWNGSASSFIDLHQFLPVGFTGSCAEAIDSSGNIVGYASGPSGFPAILWQPIPEPATLLLLGLGGLAIVRKRR